MRWSFSRGEWFRVTMLRGRFVFNESDPCAGLYVVASGHVRIFAISSSGREQVLGIDGPGSSVAELPVFDGGNYAAPVAAMDDATLLFVSKQDFQELCLTHPQAAPSNNQELASQIGMRELVSRNLSRLQSEGLIEINGRNVTVRDLKAIEAEVSSPE